MPASDQARTLLRLARESVASLRAMRRNTVKHRPAPPASGMVLDVGAGQEAHPRSDVIVDKYVADDFERGAGLDLTKALVVADGHDLPFADGAFTYAIAAHVVEHATDPLRFAAELSRVAEAGFVQVPSRESELTFGWRFHPWLVDLKDGTLEFHPRGDAEAPLGPFFHRAFTESTMLGVWFGAHRDIWHHTVHWKGSFSVAVNGDSRAPETAQLDVERTLDVLRRAGARGPEGAIRTLLRCPADGGRLEETAARLVCADCGRSYPLVGTVPVLLAESAS